MVSKLSQHQAKSQKGVALIVVLLLLAVMVTIAGNMSGRLFSQFKRAESQLSYQQAYWYSMGGEALAKVGIEQSYKDSDTINLSQPWALEEQTYPLDYGTLTGRLFDQQACFNLNALSSLKADANSSQSPYLVEVLQALLEELDVENYQAEVVASSVWDYVDSNSSVNSALGVEDSHYESMNPAYMSANSLIADGSELRAVNQVTGDVMHSVAPYVCALPTTDFRLNVNTVMPEHAALIAALFYPTLSRDDAKQLLDDRPFDGWSDIDEFFAEPGLNGVEEKQRNKVKPYLGVDSAYFELDAELLVDRSRVRVRSLIFSNNRETATVISRRFGGIGERVSDRSTEQ